MFQLQNFHIKTGIKTGIKTQKKPNKLTYVEDTLRDEWHDIESEDGDRTKIPPTELNLSEKKGFACQWGCMTAKTHVALGFRNKGTFLQHITEVHPHLRIAVETPPVLNLNGNPSQGIRLIVQQSDVLAEHDA